MSAGYEKKLFELQKEYRMSNYDSQVLSEMYVVVKKYCENLFNMLKAHYVDSIASDVASWLIMEKVANGDYVKKSWMGLIIPKIKEFLYEQPGLPLHEYELFYNFTFEKREDLFIRIEKLLYQYLDMLEVREQIYLLAFLNTKKKSIVYMPRVCGATKFWTLANLWLKIFKKFLETSRKETENGDRQYKRLTER